MVLRKSVQRCSACIFLCSHSCLHKLQCRKKLSKLSLCTWLVFILLDFLHQPPPETGHIYIYIYSQAGKLCSESVHLTFAAPTRENFWSLLAITHSLPSHMSVNNVICIDSCSRQPSGAVCNLCWYPLKQFPFFMALSATDSTQTGSRKLSSNCLLQPVSLARSHLWHQWLKRLLCLLDLAIFQWLLAGNSISVLVCYWGLLDWCRSSVCLSF